MKVSLNWLSDYVDVSMPVDKLGERLTAIGLNLEGIIEAGDDIVLDLEITSNRSDCLGHLGVARELAAATGAKFTPPAISKPPTTGKAGKLTSVEVLDPEMCPRYTARVIRGVKVGPSPQWMVERLEAVGLRSVNNVVDATNYVLMEYSQPLHSFDLGKLAGRRIVVRLAKPGETLTSIDGTKCELDELMLVIADAEKPVAVAGVMGGLDTEVGEDTTDLLIESAQFDPLSIRRTSRKLGLMSESNYRFERGVDPVAVETASLRACQLILDSAGGKLADGVVDVWAKPFEAVTVSVRPQRCCDLLGMDVPVERQVEVLDRLNLRPKRMKDRIVCTIPPYRADLGREADLIEEVARHVGYDAIPVAREVAHPVNPQDHTHRIHGRVARALAASGFDEAVTFAFVDVEQARLFGCETPLCVDRAARKTNNALRPTLLISLLTACKTNQDAGNTDVSLYELAAVFPPVGGSLPREHVELAMASTCDLRDLRGTVEALVEAVAPAATLTMTETDAAGMARGLAGRIMLDGEPAGIIGRVAADVLEAFDLEREIAAATINFEALLAASQQQRPYQPVPRFPAVKRDLSLIVDEKVKWSQLVDAIAAVEQPMRVAVEYVTTFRGKPIPSGRKSVTVTVVYRSAEGTLRSQEVDEQVDEVVAALAKGLSAELRE